MDIGKFCKQLKKIEKTLTKIEEKCNEDRKIIISQFNRYLASDPIKESPKSPEINLASLISKWREECSTSPCQSAQKSVSNHSHNSITTMFSGQTNEKFEVFNEIIEGSSESESIKSSFCGDWVKSHRENLPSIGEKIDPYDYFGNERTPSGKGFVFDRKMFDSIH